MKHLHTIALIIALLGVVNLSIAQSVKGEDTQRIVIVKKTVDEEGNINIEKEVKTAEAPEVIWEAAGVHSSDAVENNIEVNVEVNDGHKIIHVNHNGEMEVIELNEGEEIPDETKARLQEKGITLVDDDERLIFGDESNDIQKIIVHRKGDKNFDISIGDLSENLVLMGKGLTGLGDHEWTTSTWTQSGINCAALGVYVSSNEPTGVYVSNTIGESGAEEAGMQRGDVITFIDEYPTTNYRELHEALAHYEPGDVVAVTYTREGQEHRVEAQLRAWKDLPSFAERPHARVTCDGEIQDEVVSRKIIVIKKDRDEPAVDEPLSVNQSPGNTSLELQEYSAFPNPSDGKFSVRFEAPSEPIVVSIYDASGKEIFRDNRENFGGFYNRDVDLSQQAKGAVILSVEQGGKIFTDQIILN